MFTESQKGSLKQWCFASIYEELGGPPLDVSKDVRLFNQTQGVFVTLKIGAMLRGCIGIVQTEDSLYKTVYHMAKKAAFNDSRFTPLSRDELNLISIELSVLSEPTLLNNSDDIMIGQHGLMLNHPFGHSLLLPQVPVEYGWGKQDFLIQLCRKAGVDDDAWKDGELWFFSADVF